MPKIIDNDNFHKFLTVDKLKQITVSVCKDMIVYAPTQVGKTNYMFRKIQESLETNETLVIVSSCNQSALQEQTISRFNKFIKKHDIEANINQMSSSSAKKLIKGIKSNNLVLFTLDNIFQIEKMSQQLEPILKKYKRENKTDIKKIVIFYDEGDLSLKNIPDNITAKSQQEWSNFIKTMEDSIHHPIGVRRVFVSATPMLLQRYYDITADNVYSLPIPENYIGYDQLNHTEYSDNTKLSSVIKGECKIINDNNIKNSMIIYSCERLIKEHKKLLSKYSASYPFLCLITLNSKGINIVLPRNKTIRDWDIAYRKALRHIEFNPISVNWAGRIGHTNSNEIDNFYLILAYLDSPYNMTIGKNLVNRGISFISRRVKNGPTPIVASTLITLPSATSHLTNNVQCFGRITGTARPELERRLYCPQKDYDTYIQFHHQQDDFLMKCSTNGNMTTQNILDILGLMRINAKHDRLPVRHKIIQSTSYTDDPSYMNDDGTIDGVKLNNLKRWCQEGNTSNPAKIIRYLLSQPNYRCDRNKMIADIGISQHNIEDLSTKSSNQGFVITNSQIIKFNPNIFPKIQEFLGNL